MTNQIDELMRLADVYAAATECGTDEFEEATRLELRTALEAALKDCRNATLEEAVTKCNEVYYKNIGEGYAEVRYGIASCAKEIGDMKS